MQSIAGKSNASYVGLNEIISSGPPDLLCSLGVSHSAHDGGPIVQRQVARQRCVNGTQSA